MKKLIIIILALSLFRTAEASFTVKESSGSSTDFPLVGKEGDADVYIDENDSETVSTVVDLFVDDVRKTTGHKLRKKRGQPKGKAVVMVGTIGCNRAIDRLISKGLIDVAPIRGGWEQYVVKTVENPTPDVGKALVIVGSDRRGAAYGLLALSEAIGVSPLYWWSDVPIKKHKALYVAASDFSSKTPSVKYRGIFINDEGWGITPWAKAGLDKDLDEIGPKTYAKVCELLLRLKGNMLAPAMHPSSAPFNRYPENAKVADRYGIIMTSSHCEPLLFNNVTEWSKETNGEWNYMTNREGIMDVLDKRVATNHPYENVYTIAMRGIHDSGLVGVPKDREVELVESVIVDQRGILTKHIPKPIDDIPQVFVPYKEVLDIYEKGLRLPDDITLVWPDDNYGYIKRLNNIKEQERSGRSGVYYHISYLGEPHDYLWLNTTPPALMFEELGKAYRNGADRYWLLNVGDIKPGELGISTFMDMAWDISRFDPENITRHQTNLLCAIFGEEQRQALQEILDTYYTLGFQHKPEAMGWGWEWNNRRSKEKVTDTDFSITNYCELEKRLDSYARIADKAEDIYSHLPAEQRDAFFELVYYPVKGAYYMNQKMLKAQLNRWHAGRGNVIASFYADEAREYADSIDHITHHYNTSVADGKWNRMMALAPGWVATYHEMPPLYENSEFREGEVEVIVPGQSDMSAKTLPCQSPVVDNEAYIDLFNKGSDRVSWRAECEAPWVCLSSTEGTLHLSERINIAIDWDKTSPGMNTACISLNYGNGCQEWIVVPAYRPTAVEMKDLNGLFVENDGYVSIATAQPHRVYDNENIAIRPLQGLGYEGASIQLGDANAPAPATYDLRKACRAEYDFYTFGSGSVTVHTYALPVFPLTNTHRTRFGILIDDGDVKYISNDAREYSGEWRDNVARNACVKSTTLNIDRPGKHTFKLICTDPGMVIQKVVIDLGGMKRSYLGPASTLVM